MTAVGVAVVSFNTREILRSCLTSIVAAGATTIVVADNGSTDGSVDMVRRDFPTILILEDPANPGYGAAANAAIAGCRTDYVLLLNSDTIVPRDSLHALAAYLDTHPSVAIVGPRLLNADGSLQVSCHQFPSPIVTLLDYSWLGRVVGRIPVLSRAYLSSFAHDRARRVDWVTGAALTLRRSAFDAVGGFDPTFFMYYEEVDLAYRLGRAGWETHFAPVVDVVHIGGASTKARSQAMYAQQIAAGLIYYERHRSRGDAECAKWAFKFGIRSRMLKDLLRSYLRRQEPARQDAARRVDEWRTLLGQLREPPAS